MLCDCFVVCKFSYVLEMNDYMPFRSSNLWTLGILVCSTCIIGSLRQYLKVLHYMLKASENILQQEGNDKKKMTCEGACGDTKVR
jgi:hypothetical protein